MFDLHCHLLPGLDDGAPDLPVALAMARLAADDGIRTLACTPHIYPGLYANTASGIRAAVGCLQSQLDREGIALRLTYGADVHVTPDLLARLRNGTVPTLNGGRYLLLEPPHHVAPPRLEEHVFALRTAGYVPIITHPERLTWISDTVMEMFERMVRGGVWMQITAGSLTGRFGRGARYWGERLLGAGLAHLLATDAHNVDRRPPLLAEGARAAEQIVGFEEARHLVITRPRGVFDNVAPAGLPTPAALLERPAESPPPTLLGRLFAKRPIRHA